MPSLAGAIPSWAAPIIRHTTVQRTSGGTEEQPDRLRDTTARQSFYTTILSAVRETGPRFLNCALCRQSPSFGLPRHLRFFDWLCLRQNHPRIRTDTVALLCPNPPQPEYSFGDRRGHVKPFERLRRCRDLHKLRCASVFFMYSYLTIHL